MKTFEELALQTNVPIAHVFRLAAHLYRWGKARIILTINKWSEYQVTASSNLDVNGIASTKFRLSFGDRCLYQMLQRFMPPRRLGDLIEVGTLHSTLHSNQAYCLVPQVNEHKP